MASKKWFSKGAQAVSSTVAADHVQFRYDGFTEHDSKADAEAAAQASVKDADQVAADEAAAKASAADKSSADTGGKPSPTPQAPAAKPKA